MQKNLDDSSTRASGEFRYPNEPQAGDRRVLFITGLAVMLGLAAGVVAQIVVALIGLVTNVSFYGRVSTSFSSPAQNHLGLWVLLIPVIGGLIVGVMARYGSAAIRGHGIPETMEQVLTNGSRVPPRITFLKPFSAAIAIGTGGPFGAEGPIIATGGALGSLIGQLLKTTADERKTLLAAGAAAGMAAIFGSPISAVLLSIELLLFEYRSRSFIPVALASFSAMAVRIAFVGLSPVFPMPQIGTPSEEALVGYVAIGLIVGLASVMITKAAGWIEELFEYVPTHWMWWPALGGLAVGVIGYFYPLTLGVGYDNIVHTISGEFGVTVLVTLAIFKFLSWSIALGSGTSGGTLAPLFTIGGSIGALLGTLGISLFPQAHLDIRVAALVGMAALFAGASRALMTSIVFAFESTLQTSGLLPLLGGCSAAYLVSSLLMKETIMTEKISKRGLTVPSDYAADYLDRILVKEIAKSPVVTLDAQEALGNVRDWISKHASGSGHQGFPVLSEGRSLIGVLSRRDLFDTTADPSTPVWTMIHQAPAVIFGSNTLRQAADLMVRERVGRLPVVQREDPTQVIGILTRSDLLNAHHLRLAEANQSEVAINLTPIGWVRDQIDALKSS